MLIYRGGSADSAFRLAKLLETVQSFDTNVDAIGSAYLYAVALKGGKTRLSEADDNKLIALLDDGSEQSVETAESYKVLVAPRIGTRSPWSSKATDVAMRCGLKRVARIERLKVYALDFRSDSRPVDVAVQNNITQSLHDPMTESLLSSEAEVARLFDVSSPAPLAEVPLIEQGRDALAAENDRLGLALSDQELDYLFDAYREIGTNPTDVELMMFAQVNSEHCRHKIFNADWVIDGKEKTRSLFSMIKETHKRQPKGTLTAYSDNSCVLQGSEARKLLVSPQDSSFHTVCEDIHLICKVETHNHPTAISPHPGAATGSGGEIRDEGATGRGSKPKAGLCGFCVSNLRVPGFARPWEGESHAPKRISSPLQIMLEGPIGAASFNNEFGRPNIAGYFRTYEQSPDKNDRVKRGYHKPIMLAGGMGSIRAQHTRKLPIQPGMPIVVLGGPAMLIGLGGGAASSVSSGVSSEALDYASVQRANAEMQRRCQEVIDACCAWGEDNPIVSIHDIGAGGLCNALPELIHDANLGGHFNLRSVLNDEPGMSPMQIWCNEAQERYCLAIREDLLPDFIAICEREKCLFSVVGQATREATLILDDEHFRESAGRQPQPIFLPMEALFGNPPRMRREVKTSVAVTHSFSMDSIDFSDALRRVLTLPSVADKSFLITIGDRSVGGMIARDQMVGPWQGFPSPIVGLPLPATGEILARRWQLGSARHWPWLTHRPAREWRLRRP